jgi:hypothetical protein
MHKWHVVLLYVAAAACAWGLYVPVVHRAAVELRSNLRAFMLVGAAYFLVAVLVPALLIFALNSDPTVKQGAVPNFKLSSCLWGLAAGTAGAVGALCVIFAVTQGGPGAAIYVAPLVFAGAPIINTVATITYFHPVRTLPDWRFFLGLTLAATGAAMVMIFKPAEPPHAGPPVPTAGVVTHLDHLGH